MKSIMRPPASITFSFVLAASGLAIAPRATLAQTSDAAPPASQPSTPPPSSLDDLLKIDKEKPGAEKPATEQPPADAAADEAKRELDKQLSEAEVANAFVQAVEKMGVAADLLDEKFDPGLGTQRVQEDIIAKLATLLDQAKKNKSQSSSSSSSSSSSQRQNQRQQDPGQRQNQQQNQANQQRNNNPADNRAEMEPPAPQDASANTILEESRTEWGNLPQRLREQLLQGRRDYMPALYRRLIDEYYKRLAEDSP